MARQTRTYDYWRPCARWQRELRLKVTPFVVGFIASLFRWYFLHLFIDITDIAYFSYFMHLYWCVSGGCPVSAVFPEEQAIKYDGH